jgi:hypothetical protein
VIFGERLRVDDRPALDREPATRLRISAGIRVGGFTNESTVISKPLICVPSGSGCETDVTSPPAIIGTMPDMRAARSCWRVIWRAMFSGMIPRTFSPASLLLCMCISVRPQ